MEDIVDVFIDAVNLMNNSLVCVFSKRHNPPIGYGSTVNHLLEAWEPSRWLAAMERIQL